MRMPSCHPIGRPRRNAGRALPSLHRGLLWALLLLPLAGCLHSPAPPKPQPEPGRPPAAHRAAGDDLLDDLARRSCAYFLEQAHPVTGLVPDRGPADGRPASVVASVAATGFGLAALCIADHRGWLSRTEVLERIRRALATTLDRLPHEHGYFYHFVHAGDATRIWESEVSSVDTAFLLAGAILCREAYPEDRSIRDAVAALLARVEWPWMLNGGRTLAIGWKPETGFLEDRWSVYAEHMLLYLLAIGSDAHGLPPATWHAWRRHPVITYGGRTFIQCPPLFTHQYAHAWIDFRNRRDLAADYWLNSRLATLAQQEYCADLTNHFPQFGTTMWGLSAADGPNGYKAWGGPPPTPLAPLDGTLVPSAVAGSIPFAPEACIATLRHMRTHYGERIWAHYGFVSSFNPHTAWTSPDVVGIDVGITLLMIENHRDGFAWTRFMKAPEIQRGLERAGFHAATTDPAATTALVTDPAATPAATGTDLRRDLRHPAPPVYGARLRSAWTNAEWVTLSRRHADIEDEGAEFADAEARFAVAWDSAALYFACEVLDRSPEYGEDPDTMYRYDSVELFVDPAGDDLRWASPADFQFGFSPRGALREWFGNRTNVTFTASDTELGYRVEAAIPWSTLGLNPSPGVTFQVSVATINRYAPDALLKLNWHWDVLPDRIRMATVTLE